MAKGIMYVDNVRVEFDDEATIMDVCRKAGVEVPNFCFHSDLSVYGACRMCMVEDEATGKIDAACTMQPKNNMRIRTNTSRLLKYRRMILELLLSAHCRDCTTCEKNRACRLQEMAVRFGIHRVPFEDTREHVPMDFSSPAVTFDLNKCILCGDCASAAASAPPCAPPAPSRSKMTSAPLGKRFRTRKSALSSRLRPLCASPSARPTACPRVKTCSTSSSRRSRSWARTKFTIRSSARTSRCAKSPQSSCAAWKRAKICR